MDQQDSNPKRLVTALIGQLECDRFLGGTWLPIGGLSIELPKTSPQQPASQTRTAVTASTSSKPSPYVAASHSHAPPQPATQSTTDRPDTAQAPSTEPAVKGPVTPSQTTPPLTPHQEQIIKAKQKTLRDIAKRIAACQSCSLAKTRINIVPGEGNPNARIVFVGEAPGASEDEQGLPFVGRAGQLLTKIIEAMGLTRNDVYICNILKCRPPNNRDPQATEIDACNSFLHEQLQTIEPEIIVALGAHAARTLLDTTTSIGQLRGRFHEYVPGPMAEPIKLIATYHPAYVLRNYSQDTRRRVWEDMQRVLKELGLPIPKK